MKCTVTGITEDACQYYNEGGCYATIGCVNHMRFAVVDPDVYDEIRAERKRADAKYGEDRNKPPMYWHNAIIDELREAVKGYRSKTEPPHDYRSEMIQAAGLIIEAINSWDRQRGKG